METKLINILTGVSLFFMSNFVFAQAPILGTTANFVLFSSDGAVSSSGISFLTGNVGTNSGSSTGFGNVNGSMNDNNSASAQCTADLLIAYNQLNNAVPTFFPTSLLGNGQVLTAGVYNISGAAVLNSDLTLNAEGNPNAVFIFQVQGSLSANINSKIKLISAAKACNVFWKVEGLVSLASNVTIVGTIIANNAAIEMNSNDTLEGRALSTSGAVSINGVLAYTPIGCGSQILTGPSAPILGSAECYAVFSGSGSVSNTGITYVTGDVGTNVGLTTGFNPLYIIGSVHPIPDASTLACVNDLFSIYAYLNTLPYDINLLYPAQFGHHLVLTPHTYLLDAATVLTDTLYLNAQGNANAVFVIQINGAFSTSAFSKIILTNGAQAKNVFWKIDGAAEINDSSIFEGTIVCNNGAVSLKTGVTMDGRAFTTTGNLVATEINAVIPAGCITTAISVFENETTKEGVTVYPNPFAASINIIINNSFLISKSELRLYNILGSMVLNIKLSQENTTLETRSLPSGIYFYNIIGSNKILQSGKLVSQN